MRVVLTGGRGLVGRNILEHPRAGQLEILAPTRMNVDLRNYEATAAYLREKRPDIVVHAAGLVGGIQANMNAPVNFLVENLDIGRNVVLAARAAGIRRLINLGSSCMYPRDHSGPLSEDLILTGPLEPTNEPYALAKIIIARLCEYIMRENSSFRFKTLIPCNLYGRHDKFDPSHSHLIPAIIHKVCEAQDASRNSIEIWGDGEARREFMYAGDFADALLRAIDLFDTLPEIMNIGLGHDYSINEYYRAVAEVLEFKGRFVHDIARPVGMARKLVDVSRQSAWGWAPTCSLRDGIKQTCAYYLETKTK